MKKRSFLLGAALAMMVILGGCSSNETQTTTNWEAQDRGEYIRSVDRKLDGFEKQASEMSDQERGRDMMANINDTRAELRKMESDPSIQWQTHRDRVQTNLQRLEELESATAE